MANRYLLPQLEGVDQPWLTVVLDLDETLVNNRRLDLPQAILRPYVLEVLYALRQLPNVELVLWTASTEETATPVVSQLSVRCRIFDEVIFRNPLWFTEPFHTKDIRLLGRNTDRVVVFDNAPACCKFHPNNSVLIEDFTGVSFPGDTNLVSLYRIVQRLLHFSQSNVTVQEALRRIADENLLCRRITYYLTEQWSRVAVHEVDPLMVPPHGDFFKILPTNP